MLLEVKNLHTFFDTEHGIVRAVDGVSFTLGEKQTIGIVGESGSGKSQTVMSILKLFESNQYIAEGEIWFKGQKISTMNDDELSLIRGKEISVIFQDSIACLNPVFSVEQQLCELMVFHDKISKQEARKRALDALVAVKIPDPERVLAMYPHQLSGGMSQRVMIAIALACKPKILIADEPTTALDVIVQDEILTLMQDLKHNFDTSIIFISHDLGVIHQMADYIIVMNQGKVVEEAPTRELIHHPKHPYTKQLLNAFLMTDIQEHTALQAHLSDVNHDTDHYTIQWPDQQDEDWFFVNETHKVSCTLK